MSDYKAQADRLMEKIGELVELKTSDGKIDIKDAVPAMLIFAAMLQDDQIRELFAVPKSEIDDVITACGDAAMGTDEHALVGGIAGLSAETVETISDGTIAVVLAYTNRSQ